MPTFRILAVGKDKEAYSKQAINEYQKRLSRFGKVWIEEVEDERIPDNASLKEEELVKIKEGARLLKRIQTNDFVIALDLHGTSLDSEAFAKQMEQWFQHHSTLTFLIAGSLGYSEEVLRRANMRWKLSDLTFPHLLVRILVLEQIYRANKINANEIYHK